MTQPPKKLSSTPIRINTPAIKSEHEKQDFIQQDLIEENFNGNKANGETNSLADLKESSLEQEVTAQEELLRSRRKYDRVSMRLLEETKKKLIALKTETSIPYEVIVDVMVRHWDELSERTKSKIIKLAQAERHTRLIEGQQKSMQTTMARLKR